MMRKLILFCAIAFMSTSLMSQTTEDSGIKLKKDDFLVDAYVGYPNWGVFNLTNYVSDLASSELKSTGGVVPVGLKAEFFLSDEISFTLDASYIQWSAEWKYNSVLYDTLGEPANEELDNSYEASRFAFQVGVNYHIPDIDSENLDVYMGFAVGSNNINDSQAMEQPDFNAREQNYFLTSGFILNSSVLAQTPLSVRLRVGGRYFLTNNVALNVEAGTGLRTILFGASYKF